MLAKTFFEMIKTDHEENLTLYLNAIIFMSNVYVQYYSMHVQICEHCDNVLSINIEDCYTIIK